MADAERRRCVCVGGVCGVAHSKRRIAHPAQHDTQDGSGIELVELPVSGCNRRHRCLHCRKQLESTRQVMRQVWPAYLSIGGSSISGTVRTTRSHHHRVLCIVA